MSSLVTFVIGIDTFISRRAKIVPILKRYGCLRFLPHDATQSTLLPEQVVRPSVCDVQVSWPHRLKFFDNNFMVD